MRMLRSYLGWFRVWFRVDIWVFGVLDTSFNAGLHSFGFFYVYSCCPSDSTVTV